MHIPTLTIKDQSMVAESLENPEGLSACELEVAGLIAQGYTTEEIVDKICLSVSTIKSYGSKLSLKSRV